MTTLPHPNRRTGSDKRPAVRCFRHHVWMAYCGDCRTERAPLLRDRQDTGTGQR